MRGALAVALAAGLVLSACSDDGGDERSSASSSTTTIVYEGDPASAFCSLLRDLALDDVLSEPSETAADVEAAFGHLLDVLHQTAAAAPPELEEDTALLVAGIAALDDALRAVGYSYDALADSPAGPQVSAAVNDPAFTVAGEHITAYKQQVCGL